MSWEHEFARRLKTGRETGPGSGYLIGQVLSPKWDEETEDWTDGDLIISVLDGAVMLTAEMLDRLPGAADLHDGQTAVLIPGPRVLHGGQRFLLLGGIENAV